MNQPSCKFVRSLCTVSLAAIAFTSVLHAQTAAPATPAATMPAMPGMPGMPDMPDMPKAGMAKVMMGSDGMSKPSIENAPHAFISAHKGKTFSNLIIHDGPGSVE